MDALEARRMAQEAIQEHCPQFTFAWKRSMTVMGTCDHQNRVIALSKPLVEISDRQAVLDTILHEIAHALVGGNHHHDYVWQAKARELGAPTKATISEERVGNPRETLAEWVGVCPSGHVSPYKFFRKPKANRSCHVCDPKRYHEEFKLTYRKGA